MDISHDGPELAPHLHHAGNNLSGTLRGRATSSVASRFVGAGWRSRSSSWEGYEVGTDWCEVELDPVGKRETLLNGVVDPDGLDALAALLTWFGVSFRLELCDERGGPVREVVG
ncbi:hypothetical protein [Streptomyces sp. NPDC059597]|uniref:hypothetical protein n=1 Tax=Streptomyces sp. NPDC059597 TaxID=3346879 RepID=UPI003698E74A